jgi:LysM repeat protein
MKRICFFLVAASLCGAPVLRGQDAAVEERLNKLNGHVEDLLAAQAEQQKRLAALAKEIDALREQQNQPNTSYANQEELRKLAEKLQEIDQKRVADNERIVKEIEKLGQTMAVATPPKKTTPKVVAPPAGNPAPSGGPPEKGFEYTIAAGDTLSTIAQAYREKNIKVSVSQILKANPGLDANKLKAGQKIFIPAPAQ